MPEARRPTVALRVMLLVAIGQLLPEIAAAHGVHVFAAVEGDKVQGRAEFVGGSPLPEARVEVFAPSGRSLGSTKTDGDGRFTFEPVEAVDHRFWVNDGAGHGAEHTVKSDELPASLRAVANPRSPSGAGSAAMSADKTPVATQVRLLREEIADLRRSIRLHDILGGIGYIAGLTGLWFFIKARRRQRE